MDFWENLRDRLDKIAKRNMWEPKEKADPNVIKLDKADRPLPFKMTPEDLEAHMKANRGVGYHKNPKDKRAKNPKKQDFDY